MAGDRRDGRVGEIIGGHIDRLDRRHRRAGDRGDAFLQPRHFGRQRRLVADAGGQAAEQAGHLGARLNEAEHVVHQQQHVLVLLIAEIFGNRQRGQRRPPARAGRLVHLAIDQHGARQNAGALHFGQQFMALARPLADAGKDRDAFVFLDHGADQLHHQNRLADARAAEHRGLAALRHRRQQVDHLDAGLEHLGGPGLVAQRRRAGVDRAARRVGVARRGRCPADRPPRRAAARAPPARPARSTGAPVARTATPRARPAVD